MTEPSTGLGELRVGALGSSTRVRGMVIRELPSVAVTFTEVLPDTTGARALNPKSAQAMLFSSDPLFHRRVDPRTVSSQPR